MPIKSTRKTKSPPVLSHEFIIQNHGDIVSCVAMVIVMGLMFQVSSPLASLFIILQYNLPFDKDASPNEELVIFYNNGSLDLAAIFFYALISVVCHAVIQEYVIDRVSRKLHLSKVKHSKFNESGQLLLFNVFSAAWAMHIIFKDESITSVSSLWAGYPEDHIKMTFRLKFFFIVQISYWLHNYSELYFQRVKKEEMFDRIVYTTIHLVVISAAYALNFTRLGLILLTLHYVAEATLNASRLLHFAEINKPAAKAFKTYNTMFPVLRLLSIVVTLLTMQVGMAGDSAAQGLDVAAGNFNTPLIRVATMVIVSALQTFLGWRFITFHLRKRSERKALQAAAAKKKQQLIKAKKSKRSSDDDVDLLPEVDQNTHETTRRRN